MKVRVGLRMKFILLFLVFSAAIAVSMIYVVQLNYGSAIVDKYYNYAIGIAKLSASVLDGDRIIHYAETLEADEEYQEDLARLDNIKMTTGAYYLYVMYPMDEEHGIYIYDASLTEEQQELTQDTAGHLGDEVYFGEDFASAFEVLQTGEPSVDIDITNTQQGSVMQSLGSVYAPIKDSAGTPVAFVGVDISVIKMREDFQDTIYYIVVMIIIVSVLALIIMLMVVNGAIIQPVRRLNVAAEQLAEGEMREDIRVRGSDEISVISRVFNRMSHSIQGHMDEVNQINEAYRKYVPNKFFEWLHKDRVTDMVINDQVERELSILSFDIEEFDSLTRPMTTEDMFRFVNNIHRHAIPIVEEHGGVIESFAKSGFLALYSESVTSTLDTAVSLCQEMNKMNRFGWFGVDRKIVFGIGITYGSVLLGIVGHESRMAAMSISQQTENAEFLRKMAARYGARILITGTSANHIPGFEEQYHHRFLGLMKNEYSGSVEKIFDVYDGDGEEDMRAKDKTREIFERGVTLFYAMNYQEARNEFVEVLRNNRRDIAAKEYLYLCNEHTEHHEQAGINEELYLMKY